MTSSEKSKTFEFRVGAFVLFGLVILATMVVTFGRFGIGLKNSYPLTLELPNANGLIKNSKVLMAGALVGSVIDEPKVLDRARGVSVTIIVYHPIKVARNARIVVGSSGLLGDRYVDIMAQPRDEGGYYQAGDTVQGKRADGMEEIQKEGGLLVGDLRDTVATLHKTIERVDRELLKEQTFRDLQAAMANLRTTTENFRATSEKLSGVVEDAHGVMAKAGEAVGGAKDTLATAKSAAEDVRGAIGDARKVIAGVKGVTDQAIHGDGLLPTLISDKTLSDNVGALVGNLRRSGILFYKDRPAPAVEPAGSVPPAPSPGPRRRTSSGR